MASMCAKRLPAAFSPVPKKERGAVTQTFGVGAGGRGYRERGEVRKSVRSSAWVGHCVSTMRHSPIRSRLCVQLSPVKTVKAVT